MNILFVSHDASRTGAPLMLYYFMKWLKEYHPEVSFDLLVLKSGKLEPDFKKLVSNYYVNSKINSGGVFKRLFEKIFRSRNAIEFILLNKYDLIYANSVVSLDVSRQIKNQLRFYPKLICHVHELSLIISMLAKKFHIYNIDVDHFIGASNKVTKMLNEDFGINYSQISTVYEFSGLEFILNESNKNNERTEFVVGGAGTGHWRKGTDIFLLIAYWVLKRNPGTNIKFKWVGAVQSPDNLIFENDIKKLGITDNIEFLGEVENPSELYKNFDVFLLTSREDPFPLVAIEVGKIGVPIICFSNSTGTEEVLQKGGGKVVPYLDIEEMGNQVISYYENDLLREIDGNKGRQLFSKFTPELISPDIFGVIKKVLN